MLEGGEEQKENVKVGRVELGASRVPHVRLPKAKGPHVRGDMRGMDSYSN